MTCKFIEIYYDVLTIPGIDPENINLEHALDFRNEAMDFIEAALVKAELGSWTGAEAGMDEVNFGYEVTDFEAAEKLIRETVEGTAFANIRDIIRTEADDEFEEDDDPINREAVQETLTEIGFEAAELLAMAALPCQRLIPTASVDESEQNQQDQTQFGGVPEVPPTFQWPRRNGAPLAFLAQVDFWEDGQRLLFFYDATNAPTGEAAEDQGSGRVFAISNEGLVAATIPDDLPDDCRFDEVDMTVSLDILMPDYKSQLVNELGLSENDIQMLEELDKAPNENAPTSHHLMGYPALVTEDMELSVQLAANGLDANDPKSKADARYQELAEGADEWTLLFQCDSDTLPGWDWGNGGILYFWIQDGEYMAHNFDNVWVMRQARPSS